MTKKLVVLSGGMDSTTLLYKVKKENPFAEIYALGFDYGQRHYKELDLAMDTCIDLEVPFRVVELCDGKDNEISYLDVFQESSSSLINPEVEVPEGHYAAETMKATVVPNRNMVMASVAAANALSISADSIYLGVHAGDHFIYPDCRQRFIFALDAAIRLGNMGFGGLPILMDNEELLSYGPDDMFVKVPFITWSKEEIAIAALDMGVPLHQTWSCYQGGDIHCGKCGTCVERLEAIDGAIKHWDAQGRHLWDETVYANKDFWKEQINA
jgi:7-cyano-7-deazaguanine synthase